MRINIAILYSCYYSLVLNGKQVSVDQFPENLPNFRTNKPLPLGLESFIYYYLIIMHMILALLCLDTERVHPYT